VDGISLSVGRLTWLESLDLSLMPLLSELGTFCWLMSLEAATEAAAFDRLVVLSARFNAAGVDLRPAVLLGVFSPDCFRFLVEDE